MAITTAHKRRKARQDELREWLSKQKIARHILRRIDEMGNIKANAVELEDGQIVADVTAARLELDKLKSQNADSLKLLNKYLPDERSLEIAGDPDRPMTITSTTFVGVSSPADEGKDENNA